MKSSWTRTTLGDLVRDGSADYQTGPFGTMLKASEYSSEGSPLISVGEIREGYFTIHDHTPRVCAKIKAKLPQFILEEGDIVFGRKGAINRNAIVMNPQAGWFLGSDGIRLRLTDKHDPAFFSYFLRTKMIGDWLLSNGQGAIMPSLNQRILDRLPLFLPSKAEQRRISSALTALDAKIELNNRINAELEGMAKLLYGYWFVQFDFPMTTAQAAALGKPHLTGHPYRASGGKMIFCPELKRNIPEAWKVGDLSELCSTVRGVTYSKADVRSSTDESTIPILRATNVNNGVVDLSDLVFVTDDMPSEDQFLDKFDILIVMSSGSKAHVGKNALYCHDRKVAYGAFCSKIVPREACRFFVSVHLQTDAFKKFISNVCLGTNINNLTNGHITGHRLVIPPQDQLLGFENMVASFFEKIACNHQQNQELTQLRDWLLPMLMNGQVTVGTNER